MADKTRTPTGSLAKLMATKGGGRSASKQTSQVPFKAAVAHPQEPDEFEALEVAPDNKPAYPTRPHDPRQEAKAVEVKTPVEPEPVSRSVETTAIAPANDTTNGQITVSKLSDNDTQTVGKRSAIDTQSVSELSDNGKQQAQATKERSAKGLANGKRTVSNQSAIGKQTVSTHRSDGLSFFSLVGVQKTLVTFYYESIQANGGESTHEIRSDDLETLTGSGVRTIIDANYRLTKKGFIYRTEYKDGRAGWTKFGIEKSIKEQIHKSITVSERSANGKQTVGKLSAKGTAERSAGAPSSSIHYSSEDSRENSLTSKTATTEPDTRVEPDYGWTGQIDIPPEVAQLITESHLRQLARHGFTTADSDLVQRSLDNMTHAMGLGHQYKKPASVFLAVMKREGYFSPVESFEFNRERARLLMEADKAKVEDAVQQEITRLAYEKAQHPKGSLDDAPF